MPINLASPGIVVREVDLTIGRVDATSGAFGGIVAPFTKGPVDTPILVQDESDLLDTFGEPQETDKHYEHWLVASSYLAYGGNLRVVRADDDGLKNAFTGTASDIKIKSTDHYNQLGYDNNTITGVTFASRNPGLDGNGIRVATIDAKADQILTGISTVGLNMAPIAVGYGVTQPINTALPGAGTTTALDGYLKGIVTVVGSTSGEYGVKVLSHVSAAGVETKVDYQRDGIYQFNTSNNDNFGDNKVAIHTA